MSPQPATVGTILDAARDLVAQVHPDIEKLLTLLANIPTNDLDVQTCGAIHHARKVAAGVRDGSAHTAVVRFALARVIVLLEQHVATGLP